MASRLSALLLLMLLAPLMVFAHLLVRIIDGTPAVFRQQRMGVHGIPFTLLKFRTMRNGVPDPSQLGPVGFHHPFVTRLGSYMRRLRIDETPQLFNVLRGDMVLVGPRPRLMEERWLKFRMGRLLLSLKPGLTGLAEVSGNVLLNEEEQMALDLYFIRHRSILMTLRILGSTVLVVLRGPRRNEKMIELARTDLNFESERP